MNLQVRDALKALATLKDVLREPFTPIVRDATIQRFEYTFEAAWKALREYLKEREGILANSPKSCFREAFSLGLFTEEETTLSLEMTDRRNETSHTYREEIAQAIYQQIPAYCFLMESLLKKLEGFSD
ncbi:MAG: HI0074 family nucleotidyltransferase substrate-binding subunit [Coprothermobacterota bacterium]|nr:HI0074 family nucleotidyltransferase substrate-binding subunit [Coprothermobacterota bacterium]